MSHLSKALTLGIIAGLSGLIISLTPLGHELEEKAGLDLLFHLRGPRQAPSDVVVVSVDKLSADKLRLPNRPDKWPHSLHARVVENLSREGARVIVFDIFFSESRTPEKDILFADAISKAGNVVLVAYIKKEKILLDAEKGSQSGEVSIEKLMLPIPPLAQASAAVAPLPLPKVPVRVRQYWTFKTTAGDIPTLPVTVFQLFTLDVYEEFITLLQKFNPPEIANLPHNRDELIDTKSITRAMVVIRNIFESDPLIAHKMQEELRSAKEISVDVDSQDKLKSLIKMYQSPESNYLNFYGPPHAITTIPYYKVLQPESMSVINHEKIDFSGKAVFIGVSETFQPEQKDGYYTVFSQSSGVDISGIEIAATAFANLSENMPVQPAAFLTHLIIIFFWGAVIGIFCRFLSNITAISGVLGMSVLYFIMILHQFTTKGTWYPLAVPLLFQLPLVLIGATVWKYYDTNRERQNIRKAFSYYLPDDVVERISKNIADIRSGSQVVYGICLSTDAEHFTSISETLNPAELSSFMNRYYQSIFEPVKKHGGIVSNVIGDAMLAVWVTAQSDLTSKRQACLAALDIKRVLHDQSSHSVHLPTRIGLHSGHISLAHIGAEDHYEYRPVGDIVNTSTRIEGMNKYLGTKILVSSEVLSQLDGFLSRELGKFLLKGKAQPLVVHELICPEEECTRQQKELCEMFSEALDAYRKQSWREASKKFDGIIKQFGEDGPSRYYLNVCREFKDTPYREAWDGVIRLDNK
jgi:adenylate cyclase